MWKRRYPASGAACCAAGDFGNEPSRSVDACRAALALTVTATDASENPAIMHPGHSITRTGLNPVESSIGRVDAALMCSPDAASSAVERRLATYPDNFNKLPFPHPSSQAQLRLGGCPRRWPDNIVDSIALPSRTRKMTVSGCRRCGLASPNSRDVSTKVGIQK